MPLFPIVSDDSKEGGNSNDKTSLLTTSTPAGLSTTQGQYLYKYHISVDLLVPCTVSVLYCICVRGVQQTGHQPICLPIHTTWCQLNREKKHGALIPLSPFAPENLVYNASVDQIGLTDVHMYGHRVQQTEHQAGNFPFPVRAREFGLLIVSL